MPKAWAVVNWNAEYNQDNWRLAMFSIFAQTYVRASCSESISTSTRTVNSASTLSADRLIKKRSKFSPGICKRAAQHVWDFCDVLSTER